MQDFDKSAGDCPFDFGHSDEGLLLQKLTNHLKGDYGLDYDRRTLQFWTDNKDTLRDGVLDHSYFGMAIFRIASVIGDQALYNDMLKLSISSQLVWEPYPDGVESQQKFIMRKWLKDAVGKNSNKCKLSLAEKVILYGCLLFENNDPYIINEIVSIGLAKDHLRDQALKIATKATKLYSDNPFVATAMVSLTRDFREREDLAKAMFKKFPNQHKLERIINNPNYEQPGYRRLQSGKKSAAKPF